MTEQTAGTDATRDALEALQEDAASALSGWQVRREVEIDVLRDAVACLCAARGQVTSGSWGTLPVRIVQTVALWTAASALEQLVEQLEEPALPFLTLRTMAGVAGRTPE